MRKIFYCCLFVGVLMMTACKNQMTQIKDFKDQVGASLWHTVLDQVNLDQGDSLTTENPRPLNYLLREGFAAKFGL